MQLIIDLLAPLLEASDDRDAMTALLAELGWEIELDDAQAQALREAMALPGQLQTIAQIAQRVIQTQTIDVADAQTLLDTAREIFETVRGYANGDTLGNLAQVPHPFDDIAKGEWEEMALRLPDYLITNWLNTYYTPLYEVMFALDLISEQDQETDGAPDARLPVRRSINWALLEPTLTDPVGQIAQAYDWDAGFDVGKALENLNRILASLGIFPSYRRLRPALVEAWMDGHAGPEAIEMEGVILDRRASFGGAGGGSASIYAGLVLGTVGSASGLEGIALTNLLRGSLTETEPLAKGVNLVVSASGEADRALDLRLRPSGIELIPGDAEADIRIALEGRPDKPWRLIGSEGKAGVELAQFTVSAATQLSTNGDHDLEFAATTTGAEPGLRIIIAPGDGDGFIGEIFGEAEFTVTGDVGARWSLKDGFRFDAGVGFDVLIPIDLTLGPIGIDSLRLKLLAALDGVTLDAAVTGGLDIAVMQVVVEEIGVRAQVVPLPQAEQPGNIGPLDLRLKFLPPKGMGLSINAGDIVRGGGYLFHDAEAGEYAGVGQITFTTFSLTAIGMLATKLPDNEPGWSLFLSVFSEFPPIQLAFGITLNGVGGLVGLHRTFDDEALRERLRDGALESIMFPPDPIANAPQILADLRAIFPVSKDQFVFGVMCRLGWGTPRLITADIGVIIEFPDPIKIALLGRMVVAIPEPSIAIVEIGMDVFGVVNLTEKTFKLDATLSGHVLHLFQLSGDMAMRMSWGDQPNVLISMGGFHPDFVPPEGTPALARMRAALPLGDNAAVELTAYVAITSNTFQAGGRIDVWVKVSGFDAEGWFSFDALIQFDPFGFEFRVTFGVSVSKGGTTLMGVDVVAVVTGPGLWTVDGTASFKFLGVKKSIHVDITVGEERPAPITLTDVAFLVRKALEAPEALEIRPPEEGGLPVVLTERDGAAPVLPSATLELWQKVAPFGMTLEKYGTGGVDGADLFRFDTLAIGSGAGTPVTDDMRLEEWFSPAAFVEMTDAEKLTTPSYQMYDAGLSVGSQTVETSTTLHVDRDFETVTLDPELNTRNRTAADLAGLAGIAEGPRADPGAIPRPGATAPRQRTRQRGMRGAGVSHARAVMAQAPRGMAAKKAAYGLSPRRCERGD